MSWVVLLLGSLLGRIYICYIMLRNKVRQKNTEFCALPFGSGDREETEHSRWMCRGPEDSSVIGGKLRVWWQAATQCTYRSCAPSRLAFRWSHVSSSDQRTGSRNDVCPFWTSAFGSQGETLWPALPLPRWTRLGSHMLRHWRHKMEESSARRLTFKWNEKEKFSQWDGDSFDTAALTSLTWQVLAWFFTMLNG